MVLCDWTTSEEPVYESSESDLLSDSALLDDAVKHPVVSRGGFIVHLVHQI